MNPKVNVTTHQTGSWLASPKQGGGSEMGKYPCIGEREELASSSLMQNTPTHRKRDPHYPMRGGFIPSIKDDKEVGN